MSLVGSTKIILTDTQTGETEIIEHKNRVTNFVSDVLSYCPFGAAYRDKKTQVNAISTLLPPFPELIGGIALFHDPITISDSEYRAPMSNPLMGYAAYGETDNKSGDHRLGVYNADESGYTDLAHTGFRFVFDFATTRANGTIQSVCLVPRVGGISMHGSPINENANNIALQIDKIGGDVDYVTSHICAIDPDKNLAYAVYVQDSTNRIAVKTLFFPTTKIGLFRDFSMPLQTKKSSYITSSQLTNFAKTPFSDSYFYGTFLDGQDGWIWGFQQHNNAQGNSSGTATINWIKIKKESIITDALIFEEGQFTVNAPLFYPGKYHSSLGRTYENINYTIIKTDANAKKWLYFIKYTSSNSMKGVYKINITNLQTSTTTLEPILITFRPGDKYQSAPFKPLWENDNYPYQSYRTNTAVNDLGGTVHYTKAYINGRAADTDDEAAENIGEYLYYSNYDETKYICPGILLTSKPNLHYGPYVLGFSYYHTNYSDEQYKSRTTYNSVLPMTYLATINNLGENFIVKDDIKTMKIIYTIQEVEDT